MKKLPNLLRLIVLCFPLLFVTACQKSLDDVPPSNLGDATEDILIQSISNITTGSAIIKADNRFDKISEMGLCWSDTTDKPNIYDFYLTHSPAKKVFAETIKYLQPETTYTVRAYSIQKGRTYYSKPLVFTTLKKDVKIEPEL